ncbi:TetR/AcrR family transcriptional regulator [Nocardia yamanashiensis]|uniref:TetR/AcrR family transcriptional regulator n=1 Tax=Nocardia yamanashiensis TaxID=209247 RepID=UPI001E412DD2|nr:TetR/AcrR family transcriptional regulator [Nocardia yamanashiensis]UGT43395.1 TetR/AcrR family transcriptional regulator [Nocardia yamanashiensis]
MASDLRKSPKQQRALDSRERVVEAAAQLFAERGIADTSTNRIAAHAGMSIGTLYRYFADREEIVEVLRTRFLAEIEERFTTAVLGTLAGPPRDAVAASLRAIADTLAAQEGLARALVAQIPLSALELTDLERRLLVLTRAYLLHQWGPRDNADLDGKALVMMNTGLAASFRIAFSPKGIDRDRLIEDTAAMIGAWIESEREPA